MRGVIFGVALLVAGCASSGEQVNQPTSFAEWGKQIASNTAARENMPMEDRPLFLDCFQLALVYKMPDDVQAKLLAIANKPDTERTAADKRFADHWVGETGPDGMQRVKQYMQVNCPALYAKYS